MKKTEKDPLKNIDPGYGMVMVKTDDGESLPVSKPTNNINALSVTEEIANQKHGGNAYIIMSEDDRPNKG